MTASSYGTSRPLHLICPACESGEVQCRGPTPARCDSCGGGVGRTVLEALRQIVALPEVVGAHACECGHPEMRRLPDGVLHCPACGSEVLPLKGGRSKQGEEEQRYKRSKQ